MKDTEMHYHKPVMVSELMQAFGLKEKAPLKNSDKKIKIIDATVGTGGHSLEFIKAGAKVLGIEWDKDIFMLAEKRLDLACPASEYAQKPFKLVNTSYENIQKVCKENDFLESDAVLMDLGVNSLHLDQKGRGFSFTDDESPLDMRFNPDDRMVDAAALLNLLDKQSLTRLFSEHLNYKDALNLSNEIVRTRKNNAYRKVSDLKKTIGKIIKKTGKISPETLPFMALRVAVNTELANVQNALPEALSVLKESGVLAVISFHSGEDRVVKNVFKRMSEDGLGEIATKRPKKPSKAEIENNPRARSARLRIIKKI
ncbi:16S rRNA (cytosine(1402)-N(4))-methyltransferase RsmH [Candidatus Woesebacteria bacterium]|nr:16S rRNA (cytosine(1402)-N(4))-methyltransferase RsmH [Candidatus Woesebacteria bacterium]